MTEPSSVVVVVAPAAPPTVTITEQRTTLTILSPGQGPQGPQGPAGAKGDTGDPGPGGQPRFSGDGPPGVLIGANPGDEYLDNLTGDIYRLV